MNDLIILNFKFLDDKFTQNEAVDLTPSESCQSSDEDSDVGAILGFSLENQSSATELIATSHVMDTASSPASQAPLIDHLDTSVNNLIKKIRLKYY